MCTCMFSGVVLPYPSGIIGGEIFGLCLWAMMEATRLLLGMYAYEIYVCMYVCVLSADQALRTSESLEFLRGI